MSDSPDADLRAYVRAAAQLLALPLADERIERVAVHLARTQALAQKLGAFPMEVELEPAEIYCPAPFPSVSDSEKLTPSPASAGEGRGEGHGPGPLENNA